MGKIVVDDLWTVDEEDRARHERKRIIFEAVARHIDVDISNGPLAEVHMTSYQASEMIRREHGDEDVEQAAKYMSKLSSSEDRARV